METEAVHVEVTVPETEPVQETQEANPVTVVETGSSDDALTATVIEHEGEISEIASSVDDAQATADAALTASEAATAIATEASQAAVESVAVVAEMIAEAEPEHSPEDDIPPAREHWFFR